MALSLSGFQASGLAGGLWKVPSPADRLRDAEVSEEVAQLLVGQAVQQALRHQARAGRIHLADVIAGERDVRAVEPADHNDVRVFVSDETVQGASVFGLHEI